LKPKTPTVKNLLDDVFQRPEKDVAYFVGVMRASGDADRIPTGSSRSKQRLQSGTSERFKAPNFTTQVSGNIQIQHAWDDEDYVWHIEPANRRRWVSTVDRAIYATAKTMKDVIPDNIYVRIYRPYEAWHVKVFTFKAVGLAKCWNIARDDIDRLNTKLFAVLNALV